MPTRDAGFDLLPVGPVPPCPLFVRWHWWCHSPAIADAAGLESVRMRSVWSQV